jgi:hypothetical protein
VSGIQTYVDEITGRAAGVAASFVGEQFLSRNTANRAYVWTILYDEFEAPSGHGREGKQIHNRIATFMVRCTGSSLHETEMLRAALITAAGKTMRGRSDRSYRLGRAEWLSRADNTGPHVCDQIISLVVPFFEVVLPPGPAPQDAADSQFVTVEITAREIESSTFGTLP